jgi:predicted TIM-barrel fold metal-dependent hydrolase
MSRSSRDVRAALDHPVIDFDGHILEFLPAVQPYLRDALGPALLDRYQRMQTPGDRVLAGASSAAARRRTRAPQSAWWGNPATNTRDLATAALPGLLHERLDELGIDYAVLYPTKALGIARNDDDDLRQGTCRAFNNFYADTYGPYHDRMTVAGIIPMHTPAEAIAEIEHCASIGIKLVGIPEGVWRPIPEPERDPSPWLVPGQTHWFDNFGLDSEYDYDPVWSKLVERGFPLVSHGGLGHIAPNQYLSITNYSANHIGSFRDKMYQLCKSLYLSGVTRRFPTLNLAFLECGVAWASTLLADIVEHWEKRNLDALRALDPATINFALLEEEFRRHGEQLLATVDDVRTELQRLPAGGAVPENHDDWRFLDVDKAEQLVELFAPRMFFGCEADDRTVAFAFSPANAYGATLRPVFSSDIAHWDVPDMADVVSESFELVEDGLITEAQYRDFVFTNPLTVLTGAKPSFFDGTALEGRI